MNVVSAAAVFLSRVLMLVFLGLLALVVIGILSLGSALIHMEDRIAGSPRPFWIRKRGAQ